MKTLVLSADDVRLIALSVGLDVLMDQVIERIESVCLDYEPTNYQVPPRAGFQGDSGGLLEWMPVRNGQTHTIKLVGYHPDNPKQFQLPTILSVGIMFDGSSGHLNTIADATFATALRTGAASAVASRVLAIPSARTLGLIGAGAQAVSQLHALSRVFEIEEVLVYDVDGAVAQSYAQRVAALIVPAPRIRPVSLTELLRRSDIVCTATSVEPGGGPVCVDEELLPHVHINAIGSDLPGKTELPLTLLRRSFVATDFIPQAMREGECQQLTENEVGPDLIQLVQGASQYAARQKHSTVFDSTGFALEDSIVLELLREYAMEQNLGQCIQIEGNSVDPIDPYAFLTDHVKNGVAR